MDGAVLAFAGLLTLLTAFLFGLFPAFQAASGDLQSHLKEGRGAGAGPARLRFRKGLVVVEVALSFLLVLGAGLMIRSLSRLLSVDPGFRSDRTLVAWSVLQSDAYPGTPEVTRFHRELLDRVRALPGVEAASEASSMPLFFAHPQTVDLEIEGTVRQPGEPAESVDLTTVRPGFFATLGVRLERGRTFEESDRADAPPVAVVDRAMARRFWPGEDPLGHRVRLGASLPWVRIVGVVDDLRSQDLAVEGRSTLYLVHHQTQSTLGGPVRGMVIAIRTAGDPMALAPSLRRIVADLDADVPLVGMTTLDQLVADATFRPRFATTLLGLFAILALVLGATGIYGVLAQWVALRRREIGIRKALGARSDQLAALILGQALSMVLTGVLLGGALSFGVLRVMESLFYGLRLTDPTAWAVVTLVLASSALLASSLPALRALRVEPMKVLRTD